MTETSSITPSRLSRGKGLKMDDLKMCSETLDSIHPCCFLALLSNMVGLLFEQTGSFPVHVNCDIQGAVEAPGSFFGVS